MPEVGFDVISALVAFSPDVVDAPLTSPGP